MTDLIESPAIRWQNKQLQLLDQRQLPGEVSWLTLSSSADVAQAISNMVVRGAPAIGITAAYGLALEALSQGSNATAGSLHAASEVLAASRPTAVNLFWALSRMKAVAQQHHGDALGNALVQEAINIHQDDLSINRKMAEHGAPLLPDHARVYTHCNTGALATGGHGTALGIIRTGWQTGKVSTVFAGETRPWLQGARLTSWELMQDGIPVTLVVDSAAGQLMQQGEIDAVIVGADRITSNGDVANKIGTYSLAVLAMAHHIPFYVAAPLSSIDPALASGSDIEIEQRPADEVSSLAGKRIAPENIIALNPAFDITPAKLISAIITEHGVIRAPDTAKMTTHLSDATFI